MSTKEMKLLNTSDYMFLLVLLIAAVILIWFIVLNVSSEKRLPISGHVDAIRSDDINVYYEQQMDFIEIARFYEKCGAMYDLDKFIKEEGQWWKEVPLSCPPKNVFIPGSGQCEKLDEKKPFRIKYCKGNGTCIYKYFNMEE